MAKLPKAPSIPKPFQRPGIDLSGSITRTWQETPYDRIKRGDIVPDFGKVETGEVFNVRDLGSSTERVMLKLTNIMGETKTFTGNLDYLDDHVKLPTIFAFSEG